MKFIADLHIHSKYSRATSSDLNPENLWLWAQLKGIGVVATGDCIHPVWLKELKEKLEPAEPGFFKLKEKYARALLAQVPVSCQASERVRFILSTEISNIYKKNDKVRKIHNVVIFSSFDTATAAQKKLDAIGNIKSDGRPILGMDAKDLLNLSLECDPKTLFIPAHIWTPWFSVLGSKSGFDSIEECFEDLTPHIYALETGLSSDPLMNWRLKQLDRFHLVSNSDAHSASKLGREANIFDCEFSYDGMFRALSDKKDKGFSGTIEFFPEEGKYHFDGHRDCQTRLHPKETLKNKGLCPECGKPVTVGVMARVEELADRPEGEKPQNARPYHNLIGLAEIIAEARGVGKASKQVDLVYRQMLEALGCEIKILMDVPLKNIQAVAGDVVAEGVRRMREGKVTIAAGYDGEFGTIKIFDGEERKTIEGQLTFF
ncbi:MAG: DNA helicase UvrD [Candidatus Omnitrophica bacterium]|nr:DNA helicase UvrD [Candidatus Omnitrophota bacterium]